MTEIDRGEPRYAPTVERVYRNDEVEVTWDPSLCIHYAACLRGAPGVFDTGRRPWVDLDGEPAERVTAAVEQCPTGALHARRLNQATPPAVPQAAGTIEVGDAVVEPRRNGPLFLRGRVRIVDRDGAVLREDTRVALCRCGVSENKPFCDGSHLRIEFKS